MFYIIILSQVTVVSVASPTSNATQKSMTLPVNVALGQQILTVQQSTSGSPVKLATGQNTAQVGCPAFLQNARSNLCERKRATFICTRFLNVTFYKSTFQMWRFNSTIETFSEHQTSAVCDHGRSRRLPVQDHHPAGLPAQRAADPGPGQQVPLRPPRHVDHGQQLGASQRSQYQLPADR